MLAVTAYWNGAGADPDNPKDKRTAHFSQEGTYEPALVKLLLDARRTIDVAQFSIASGSARGTPKAGEPTYEERKAQYKITVCDALYEAKQAGVKVRVILNNAINDQWSRTAATRMLEDGVPVWTTPKTMHEKFAVVDSEIVTTGSGNWSQGAFNRYHEDWIIFEGVPPIVRSFQEEFDRLMKLASPVTAEQLERASSKAKAAVEKPTEKAPEKPPEKPAEKTPAKPEDAPVKGKKR